MQSCSGKAANIDMWLAQQLLDWVDGCLHPLDGEEGRQVGRVAAQQEQHEGPPGEEHHPTREWPK